MHWLNTNTRISSDFQHLVILNQGNETSMSNRAEATPSRFSSPSINSTPTTSYFTLIVFDTSSGKITCSLVSKEPELFSEGAAMNLSSEAVTTLDEEVAKLSTKMVVSAGVFNVWKGLFK